MTAAFANAPAPASTALVPLRGIDWVIGYETDPAEPEPEHYQHGTIPARGSVDFAVFVLMGAEWLDIDQVFAAPFISELNAELNRIPND